MPRTCCLTLKALQEAVQPQGSPGGVTESAEELENRYRRADKAAFWDKRGWVLSDRGLVASLQLALYDIGLD